MRAHGIVLLLTLALLAPLGSGAQEGAPPARTSLTSEERDTLHSNLGSASGFKVRVQAAMFLGHRGDAALDLPALTRAIEEDQNHTVRGAAAMAVGNLGSPRGIATLFTALADESDFVQRSAQRALGKLAANEEAIPYLALGREQSDAGVRQAAVETLSALDSEAARMAIAGFLGDVDPRVRAEVERALSGWDREVAVAALLHALEHDSYRVRGHAAALAGRLQHPRLLEPLATRVASPLEPEDVVSAAAGSLAEMRALVDVEDQVKRVQGLVNREARVRAIVLLGFSGGPRAVEVLTRSSKDPDFTVRYHSVRALGRTGDAGARAVLEAMAADGSDERMSAAVRSALRDLKN